MIYGQILPKPSKSGLEKATILQNGHYFCAVAQKTITSIASTILDTVVRQLGINLKPNESDIFLKIILKDETI